MKISNGVSAYAVSSVRPGGMREFVAESSPEAALSLAKQIGIVAPVVDVLSTANGKETIRRMKARQERWSEQEKE